MGNSNNHLKFSPYLIFLFYGIILSY
jgi:hypothetical protein